MRILVWLSFTVLLAQMCSAGAPTRVTIDERNRLILNGRPWFLICMSGGPPLGAKDPLGRDAMDVMRTAGVNSFRVGSSMATPEDIEANAKYMDWVAEHGMYAFPNLREISIFNSDMPERREQLRSVIERFRNHPALAAWKTKDEPGWDHTPIPPEHLEASYRFIKELDPDHPVWINHAARYMERWRNYRNACDITGVDVYPISIPMGKGSHIANRNISAVGDYTELISKAMDEKKPILMVLQVCWSGAMPPKNVRVYPTFHQERYMAYQAIIKGANGLLFFGSDKGYEDQDAPYGFNWTFWKNVLKPLLKEIGEGSELHSALLVPDSDIRIKAKGAPDIEFTCREVGSFLYILAAKRELAESPITFSGDSLKGEIEVMFENRKIEAKGGSFTDRFGQNDVHVYRINRQ